MAGASYDLWTTIEEEYPAALALSKSTQKQKLYKAINHALKRAAITMRARASRIVREEYMIASAFVKKYIQTKVNTAGSNPWLRISASRKAIPLGRFAMNRPTVRWRQRTRASRSQGPDSQTLSSGKRRIRRGKPVKEFISRKGKGVSVKIKKKGRRQIIKRSFVNPQKDVTKPLMKGRPRFPYPKLEVTAIAGLSLYDTLKSAVDREEVRKAGLETFRSDFRSSIHHLMSQKARRKKGTPS